MNRNAGEEDREHDVIHRQDVRQVEEAEQRAARHRLDAVLAVRERRLQVEEVHHLRDGERDHREVDALPADRQRADDRAERRGGSGSREDRELGRESPGLGRMRAHVSGRAEEHRVAERQQPAEAEQQVERAREQREAQRLHQEHRIDADERRDREQQPP